MIKNLLHVLGVSEEGKGNGRTGKREAAWTLLGIVALFTLLDIVLAAFLGPDMTRDLTSLLIVIWPVAMGAVSFAYKLENDNKRLTMKNGAVPNEQPPDDLPWEHGN